MGWTTNRNPRQAGTACPFTGETDHNVNFFKGIIVSYDGCMPISRGNKGTYATCADCNGAKQLTDKKGRQL